MSQKLLQGGGPSNSLDASSAASGQIPEASADAAVPTAAGKSVGASIVSVEQAKLEIAGEAYILNRPPSQ